MVLKQVNDRMDIEKVDVKQLRKELDHEKHKNRIMVDVMSRMSVTIGDLTQRIEGLELGASKKSIIITGLAVSDKKEDMIREVATFIEQNLGLWVNIDDCYKLGNKQPRPIVVSLQTQDEKRDILHFKNLLKNSEEFGGVYINDYTPAATQEKRKRERTIISDNKQAEDGKKLEIKYARGGLLIQNELYKKKVVVPKPADLIQLSADEMSRILKLNIVRGEDVVKENSVFTAFKASISTHAQIRELYIKLKICQPTARHIVCAYRIPGAETHYCNDFLR